MRCEQAHKQYNRYFEVTDPGESFDDRIVGLILKPLKDHETGDNFMVMKENGIGYPYTRGRTIYLFTARLRPLNQKDQRSIEQEIANEEANNPGMFAATGTG